MPTDHAEEIFRHNARVIMQERQITQTHLAQALGMSRTAICNNLNGKERFSIERAERIARYFGIPLSAMLADKFEPAEK